MNLVYFVRHGEGVDNVARRFSCKNLDRPLTERGRLQADQTGEYLAGKNIDGIFCSPMKRARETAEILAAWSKLEPTVLEDFREVNVGELEGKEFSAETWDAYHHIVSEWFAGNAQAALPGGEDYTAMWGRMRRGLEQMLAGKTNWKLALVGHAGIFTATLKDICPWLDLNWLKNAVYYNCAVTELEIEWVAGGLQGRLIDWAHYGHLSEEALTRVPGIPPMESKKNT
jgi:probable phosphoglycerate mutase